MRKLSDTYADRLSLRPCLLLGMILWLVAASGCSTDTGRSGEPKAIAARSTPFATPFDDPARAPETPAEMSECITTGPLHDLWKSRSSEGGPYDFPIGPGDVLHISVAEVDELNKVQVRVTGDGTIELPLIGQLSVVGMTEDDVRRTIANNVRKYVIHPRVNVFVQQYRSRSVTVMGMVAKPGAYSLEGPTNSLLNMIGRAGGMINGAAQRVILFPKGSSNNCALAISAAAKPQLASNMNMPLQYSSTAMSGGLCETGSRQQRPEGGSKEPIVIDLTKPSTVGCLDVPARPGDVVLVPSAGQVGVYGWVAKPGTFDITPGMTVLGAVTAAGGAKFSSNAEILRTSLSGERTAIPIDLSKVEGSEDSDVSVQAGDVVLVKASAWGAIPYAAQKMFSNFGTGMYLPAPY
jgi:polysaccharide biosynthesis/export protein